MKKQQRDDRYAHSKNIFDTLKNVRCETNNKRQKNSNIFQKSTAYIYIKYFLSEYTLFLNTKNSFH